MARKNLTVEQQIAIRFRAWLRENPDVSKKAKAAAFDRIADGFLKKIA